jgi:hypothetical protein
MGVFLQTAGYKQDQAEEFAKLDQMEDRGQLTGDMARDRGELYQGPRAFSGHQTNAAMAQSSGGSKAQDRAMTGFGQMANTGWSGLDSLNAQRMASQANAGASQGTQQAQRQAGAQGQLQGGAALRGAIQSQQTGADQAAQAGQAIAAQGADRRLMAGQAQMALGGQMNQQAMQRGASNDAFNMWAQGMQDQEEATLRANALGEKQQEFADEEATWANIAAAGNKFTGAFTGG